MPQPTCLPARSTSTGHVRTLYPSRGEARLPGRNASVAGGGDDPEDPRLLRRRVAPAVGGAAVEGGGVADLQVVPFAAEEELQLALEDQDALLLAGVGVESAA